MGINGIDMDVVGNITREVELKFTAAGQPRATAGLACNRRWPSKTKPGEWDESVTFLNLVAWGDLAENMAESIGKGDRVMVTGRYDSRTYTGDDGVERTVYDLTVNDIAASVRFATVAITRKNKGGGAPRSSYQPPTGEYEEEPFS